MRDILVRSMSILAALGIVACHGSQAGATHCEADGSCSQDATCGTLPGNLSGAAYDISKSRFAFGSKPSQNSTGWGTRWVGADGAVAIAACGQELGAMNAEAPESALPDWSAVEQDLVGHVEAYFATMGVDVCQVGSAAPSTSVQGVTISLSRVAGDVPVWESTAYARFDSNDQTTDEGLYWPEVPSATILAAMNFSAMLAAPASLAAYKALLPASAQGDGQVVIHHSPCPSAQSAFASVATYDVLEDDSPLGMPEQASFDDTGNPVTPPD